MFVFPIFYVAEKSAGERKLGRNTLRNDSMSKWRFPDNASASSNGFLHNLLSSQPTRKETNNDNSQSDVAHSRHSRDVMSCVVQKPHAIKCTKYDADHLENMRISIDSITFLALLICNWISLSIFRRFACGLIKVTFNSLRLSRSTISNATCVVNCF